MHTPFLTADLSDKENGREAYRSWRIKVIKTLIEAGPNMWDQALECAERATGAAPTVTVFDKKYRVKSDEMKEDKGLGKKCNLSRSKIPQADLRFRMLEIMLAYLPHDNCLFREELEDYPSDQPLIKWFADKDSFFLASDRQSLLMAQAAWSTVRWNADQPLSEFFRNYHALVGTFQTHVGSKLDPDQYWDQLEVSLTDQTVGRTADGFRYFRPELAEIGVICTARGDDLNFADISGFKNKLLVAEKKLRLAGMISPPSNSHAQHARSLLGVETPAHLNATNVGQRDRDSRDRDSRDRDGRDKSKQSTPAQTVHLSRLLLNQNRKLTTAND